MKTLKRRFLAGFLACSMIFGGKPVVNSDARAVGSSSSQTVGSSSAVKTVVLSALGSVLAGIAPSQDTEIIEGIYDLVLETVLCQNPTIWISKNEYPTNLVKSKFLKLNSMHLEYVMACMKDNTTKVRNIKNYLLSALFNAPTTMSSYYQSEVSHDLACGVV